MKQLTFVEVGDLEWREVPEPRLEGDGEAIVRPLAVATCDLDLALVRGSAPAGREFAFGHEGIAEVVEIGDAVRSAKPGDLVSVPFQVSCGECGRCRRGQTGNCESVEFLSTYGLPLGPDNGGFVSDAVRVPYADAMLVTVPDGIAPARVASLSDNIPDAWRTVGPQLDEQPGAAVLVCAGAGSIALYAAASCDREGRGASRLRGRPPARARARREPRREPARGGVPQAPYTKGIRFHTGRCHARPAMEPILDLVRAGSFEPERVTRETATWDEAAEAVAGHSGKLVITR